MKICRVVSSLDKLQNLNVSSHETMKILYPTFYLYYIQR